MARLLFITAAAMLAVGQGVRPGHGWATIGDAAAFHSSNTTGLYTPEAARLLASKFRMVTIEKWQQAQDPSVNGTDVFGRIVKQLLAVKALNPAVTTVFYYNSVCDFITYSSLYNQFQAMPEGWLRLDSGEPVMEDCAGFASAPVFDFEVKAVRELWKSECLNATALGVDGCFADRAVVDGLPSTLRNVSGYNYWHGEVMVELQKAMGEDKLVMANRAFGPPIDNEPRMVDATEFDLCRNDNTTVNTVLTAGHNGKIMQCVMEPKVDVNNTVAAYLMGAYAGTDSAGRTFASYIARGPWFSGAQYDETWFETYWPSIFDERLGAPLGDAVYDGQKWQRDFQFVTVEFSPSSGVGTFHYK